MRLRSWPRSFLTGSSARFRDWATAVSKRRFVQALIFVPLLLIVNDLLYLPAHIYGQHLELKFDQSIQSWPSWFWDWTKTELITLVCAVPLAFLLYAVIRRSPRRWWLYFWLATLPIIGAVMYLEPMIIEPMFYRFEPLAATHPELVAELEKLVGRSGLAIPPDRMFEMKASEKLNSLNAYVSGFGGSKRVVVWDTTLQKLTTPETLFVFGHEMGHYVLNHIRNSLLCACAGSAGAVLGRIARRALVCRRGGRLDVASGAAADRGCRERAYPSRWSTATAAGRSIKPISTVWKSRAGSCRDQRPHIRFR